jgi:hypothetical protein
MKLFATLGTTESLRVKTFELGGHKFKVRIPLSKQMDEINERTEKIDPAKYKERFDRVTASLSGEGIEKTEDDVIVDGRSTKALVESAMRFENRMVEFVRLLVPEQGTLDDITYEDIESEWPLATQLEVISAIGEAIQPSFGEARKNS